MKKSVPLALTAILLAAIGIRLSPLLSFLYWGSDIGEYYAILRDLEATGHVSTQYAGWGVTYPYFPGMFFVQDALVALSRVGVTAALSLLVPILGALVVVPVFLLGTHVGGEAKVGLFAAAFVAVGMPHVYPTSHTAPGTLGDLLAFSALLLFLRVHRDRRSLLPFAVLSIALVITHHLSTYFLLLMIVFALFFRGILSPHAPSAGVRREVAGVAFLMAVGFAFWFGYATTFRDRILRDVNVDPWWLPLASFPILLAAMAALVRLRRRFPQRYRPRYPDLGRSVALYVLTLAFVLALMGYTVETTIPATSIQMPVSVLVFFAPFYALVALAASGRKFVDFHRGGTALSAWTSALLLSVVVGLFIAPRVIIPYRHMEYIMILLAIFAGVGLSRILDLQGLRPGRRAHVAAACGVLLVANALTAFPPQDLLGGWQEGSRAPALDAAYWSRDHGAGLVVTDHRASTLVFGFGDLDATWDSTQIPLPAESFDEAREGLLAIESPSGRRDAAYVWIDRDVQEGVQLFPWEPALPMESAAVAKFSESPFVKLFDNGYARLYWIAWGCDAGC